MNTFRSAIKPQLRVSYGTNGTIVSAAPLRITDKQGIAANHFSARQQIAPNWKGTGLTHADLSLVGVLLCAYRMNPIRNLSAVD